MRKLGFASLLLMVIISPALQGQSRDSVLKAIQQTSKWSPADQPTQYGDKNLERLAGKRAAALEHYGFTGATTQNWTGAGSTVRLTLYEMSDAAAAYGMFTLDRNTDEPGFATIPIGAEGFRTGNRAEFWQSKYVVKLEGSPTTTESLGRAIS